MVLMAVWRGGTEVDRADVAADRFRLFWDGVEGQGTAVSMRQSKHPPLLQLYLYSIANVSEAKINNPNLHLPSHASLQPARSCCALRQ